MKKIISAIIGILLIGIVVYFGVKSGDNNKFIVPFGLVSALIAPMGLSALGYSIKKEDETLQKLTKIPQIDELIEQAETEEEKIEHLKKEKEVLLDYIKNESNRIAKIERKKILEDNAKRIINEYAQLINEIKAMPDSDINIENVSEEIKELYNIQSERNVEQGLDLVILGINYCVQGWFDLYGMPVETIVEQIVKHIKGKIKKIQKILNKIANLLNKH